MASCKLDRKSSVDRDKFTFLVTTDSYLFFKNIRSIYYDIQDLPKAKWIAYRFSDRSQNNEKPSLFPVIVVDWEKNEAAILIEANDRLQVEPVLSIREKNSRTGRYYEYSLKERGRENMLEFATKIYEGILAENDIQVRYQGGYQPLFEDGDDMDNFRVVMADYYRLTRIF